jgi:hypothetical protein
MSSGNREVDLALARMAKEGKASAMTVAAPLNDAQLLSLIAGMLLVGKPAGAEVEKAVREAAGIVAKSVVAVRIGFLQKAIAAALEEESAAGAQTVGESSN